MSRRGPADHTRLFGLTWAHLLNDGASNYLPGVLPAVLASAHQPVQMAGVLIAPRLPRSTYRACGLPGCRAY